MITATTPPWTLITPELFLKALGETLQMLGVSLVLGSILGVLIGAVLALTRAGGVLENRPISLGLAVVVNLIRSLPFIILLVAILPFTRLLVGTSIGVWAAIVPLTVMIAPYIGRLVENSLLEVPRGVIEAARAMGASPLQIFWRFMLPEARGSLILAVTIASVGLLDATAMAGTVGAGGIGDLALSYGYQRYDGFAMVITVVTLIVLVQGIQLLGTIVARRFRRR
ncbi:methionine ABC transporter permease [Herbiconiux solani]|uniref:methionine ABC transporter permease n=1 Tax=Herbiconiux solani TaxID=661329 RepID=UPI0003924ACE|nr:methionine ABC transporter permease [Herbiconiux solani]AGU12042.1 Binding-protein-dependent transport system inner membrane component [uncultured organism]